MVVSPAKVMAPLDVAALALLLSKAPLLLVPVPVTDNILATTWPLRSKEVPLLTATPPVPIDPEVMDEPETIELLPASKMPVLIVVPPE